MFYRMITNARNRWLTSQDCTVKDLIGYIESTGQMRDAQVDAVKTYLFLKIGCDSKPLPSLFREGRFNTLDLQTVEEYFIFPKGAIELDFALVSQPLEWLKDYPKSHKTYCTALKQYSDGIFVRDVADNLRKTLEGFLQEFLCNDKNLETNKNEICKYLGAQGIDAGISGLFQPLINAYKNINDRIAKHNDKVDKKVLEFLLYQGKVATLFRNPWHG